MLPGLSREVSAGDIGGSDPTRREHTTSAFIPSSTHDELISVYVRDSVSLFWTSIATKITMWADEFSARLTSLMSAKDERAIATRPLSINESSAVGKNGLPSPRVCFLCPQQSTASKLESHKFLQVRFVSVFPQGDQRGIKICCHA
jgi:hypothetical protein